MTTSRIVQPAGAVTRLVGGAQSSTVGLRYHSTVNLQRPNNSTPYTTGDCWGGGPIHLANVNRYIGGPTRLFANVIFTSGLAGLGLNNSLTLHWFDANPGVVLADNASFLNAFTAAQVLDYIGVGQQAFSLNDTQFRIGADGTRHRWPLGGYAGIVFQGIPSGRDLWLYLTCLVHTPEPLLKADINFYIQDVG